MKYPRDPSGFAKVADILQALYLDYSDGYTRLTHRSAIEFAATHDFPVVIVGETGTGKEYVAKAIHRRWVQEHRNRQTNPEMKIVNCAGLSEELARSELFGHVKGSFTSAEDHKLGHILAACGCQGFPPLPKSSPRGGWSAHYEQTLRKQNANLLAPTRPVRFRPEHPMGTLFLDEFGELPLRIQTMLLRYLETAEVHPIGFEGLIHGAQTRIIVATSDPRIAQFFGVRLEGSWRSKAELDRPLRDDLLFRIKGPVIHAESVTAENLGAILKDLLDHRPGTDLPRWEESAFVAVSKAIDKPVAGDGAVRPAFGHLRELKGIIKLADAYVRHAAERGLRGVKCVVTGEIVERVWRPSVGTMIPEKAGGDGYAPTDARGRATVSLPDNLTLGNVSQRLRDMPIDAHDPALKGSKANLERAVEGLTKRLAGAAIKHLKGAVAAPSMSEIVSFLEGEEIDDRGKCARTLNKIAGASDSTSRSVSDKTVADLEAAWEQGPRP